MQLAISGSRRNLAALKHHPGQQRYGIPDIYNGAEMGLNGVCYRNSQEQKDCDYATCCVRYLVS